ncbi:START domain-containing protein [Marinobacter sp. SBS5]|uniref:START domain-containing protein n=1 Tax=Marinobacter sp. SBS5 TaxID=3401754 RepID=UPI003AAD38F7
MTITRVRGIMGILFGFAAQFSAVPTSADNHPALPAENSEHWALQKQVDNIRIYTMDQPNSGFRAFKAVADLTVPINNLMAVMINPESCKEWVHNCTESFAFGEGNFHDRYAYSVNDMPWPVSDRDYVLRIRTRGNAETGEVIMNLNATPGMRAETNSRVRVDLSNTFYRFTPTGQGSHMVWVQHTEPNGALPEWLVNQLVIDIPVKSLKALEAVAQTDKYQGYRIKWAPDGNIDAVVPDSP